MSESADTLKPKFYDFLPRRIESIYWKLFYPLLTGLTRDTSLTFLNYGFADTNGDALALDAEDEPNRACIQLYDHLARNVDLAAKCVLEVSCGHGGGAEYVSRRFKPALMHGIDRNPRAIALCRRKHKAPGLCYALGDAQSLAFPDASFDVVLNVEASHCYPDLGRFLAEVRRVLKPGGRFLYADFRDREPGERQVRDAVAASGMDIVSHRDISQNVLRGMDLNTPRYNALTRQLAPKCLQEMLKDFTGVTGSTIYRKLQAGNSIYFAYVLAKPMDS